MKYRTNSENGDEIEVEEFVAVSPDRVVVNNHVFAGIVLDESNENDGQYYSEKSAHEDL